MAFFGQFPLLSGQWQWLWFMPVLTATDPGERCAFPHLDSWDLFIFFPLYHGLLHILPSSFRAVAMAKSIFCFSLGPQDHGDASVQLHPSRSQGWHGAMRNGLQPMRETGFQGFPRFLLGDVDAAITAVYSIIPYRQAVTIHRAKKFRNTTSHAAIFYFI